VRPRRFSSWAAAIAVVAGLAGPVDSRPGPGRPVAGDSVRAPAGQSVRAPAGDAAARPTTVRGRSAIAKPAPAKPVAKRPSHDPTHDGAHARVAINRLADQRPGRDAIGRREEPLTAEEDTARQIEKLLRGPLRYGVTGLFVADARTGEALFSVNADDALNPASNVKMISTATALELLGPDFKYPTRVLGATPDAGVVHGDVYLLGSYDPTLAAGDLDEIAAAIAARGVTRIDGDIAVGPDPTRDGLYRAVVPIDVRGGEPGGPAFASAPAGMDLIAITNTARTAKAAARPRLSYQSQLITDATGHPRLAVTISGTIGRGGATRYPLFTRERTAVAAYTLRAALRAHGVAIGGELKTLELPQFIAASVASAGLPVELARHESARLADIIARVNKWSINWLADRVIMTAAALVKREPPSMELALSAMYDWLVRHPGIAKSDLVVDSGSGLSYHTRITPHELVSIVRSAAGFAPGGDPALSHAWLASLSVGGTDGTLSSRFRAGDIRGRLRAKTGTLSTVIALSGLLEVDPQRPLAFSLVTNGDSPLSPRYVRRAHEQLIGLLCRYVALTRAPGAAAAAPGDPSAAAPAPAIAPSVPSDADRADLEDLEPDPALDAETAPPP
jgi:D-alanyl-D-alanine carboxypeptidase/D-alanyl-D-alanine-endopeptidase (penicillin-binding protein 4)